MNKITVKKLFVFLTISALIISSIAAAPVSAAAITQKGSLTVITEYGENILPGMNIEIFLIATAAYNSGRIKYTPTSVFAAELKDENLDPNSMTVADNVRLAGKLKSYISRVTVTNNIAAKVTDDEGKAVFADLTAGLYLITQKESSNVNTNNGRYAMQSFIVSVPYLSETGLEFSSIAISAYPKIEPKKGTLILTKSVTGSGAPRVSFSFRIKFTAPEGAVLTGITQNGVPLSGVTELSAYVSLSASLRDGAKVTFENIPPGIGYEITEVNIPKDFTLAGITNNGKGTIGDAAPIKITATNRYYAETPPPPTTVPPTTTPEPTTEPPVTTEPPPATTVPPTTDPPTTVPPTTVPPTIVPPTTVPPITVPPTTVPPITVPPTTDPPTVPTVPAVPTVPTFPSVPLFPTDPTDPTEPDGDVSITIIKHLVDEWGDEVGEGKPFAVRLYDEDINLIGRYIIYANSGSISISGLEKGKVYYLQEEEYGTFETIGMEIVSIGSISGNAVKFRVPVYNDLGIVIIIKNYTGDETEIHDNPPPLINWPPPDENTPEIEIPDEPPPFATFPPIDEPTIPVKPNPPKNNPGTGDTYAALVSLFVILLISGSVIMVIINRKNKNKNKNV